MSIPTATGPRPDPARRRVLRALGTLGGWKTARGLALVVFCLALTGLLLAGLGAMGRSRFVPAPAAMDRPGQVRVVWEIATAHDIDRFTAQRGETVLVAVPGQLPVAARAWYAAQRQDGWAPRVVVAGGASSAAWLSTPGATVVLAVALVAAVAGGAVAGKGIRRAQDALAGPWRRPHPSGPGPQPPIG